MATSWLMCVCVLAVDAIPASGYETGRAEEEEIAEVLHAGVEDVVGCL